MKTIHTTILAICLLTMVTTGCGEKVNELIVNASNGETTFKTSKKNKPIKEEQYATQYIRKGKAFKLKITSISSKDSLVVTVSEQDLKITGEAPSNFQDSLYQHLKNNQATSKAVQTNNQQINEQAEVVSTLENEIQKQTSILELTTYEKEMTKAGTSKKLLTNQCLKLDQNIKNLTYEEQIAQRKLDSLNYLAIIGYCQNEFSRLFNNRHFITNEAQREEYLTEINKTKDHCAHEAEEFLKSSTAFLNLDLELNSTLSLFYILELEIKNLVLEKEKSFFPSQEEFTVSIKKYQRNQTNSNAEDLTQLTFIQFQRFKIFSSIGMHSMIFNGRFANLYENHDSMIVQRKGSNIIPSIGTYLNGCWRINDCLMGLGLGIGVPIQLSDNIDMTPNFNLFWNTYFQNQYGRFGVQLGFGLQKVNIIAPGFQIGDNLGSANLNVPLKAVWKPTFGIGVAYNIGTRN